MTSSNSTIGVRFKYFLEFIESCGGEEALRGKTTSEVCEAFVKPRTKTLKAGGGSLCDLLRASEATSGLVAPSAWFISHAWSYLFLEVVEAVRLFLEDECGERAGEEVVWFDVFSNDQHSVENRPFDWWTTLYQDFIRSIGSVLMVMQPWDDPVTLTRAWCVFEAYSCFATESRFEVCMTREERMRFVDMIGEDSDCILKMLGTVNSSKSSSRNPNDTERIHEAIVRLEGGFTRFDNTLLSNLQRWLLTWLGRLRDQTTSEEQRLDITNSMADMHSQSGRYEEAEELYRECLEKRKRVLGPDHPDTLMTMNNLALNYYDQEKYTEAEELYRECLESYKRVLGPDHPDTLKTMNGLAFHYKAQGRYDKAEELRSAWRK